MLYKTNKRKTEGFTIIEVMIVLAIAGLILLIVFLAVPALQRSSRNTQRKNDVSALLAAISDYQTNNAGALPAPSTNSPSGVSYGTNTVTFSNGTSGSNSETATIGYYAASKSGVVLYKSHPEFFPKPSYVVLVEGYTCNSTFTDAVKGAAKSVVALYTLETNSQECQEE